MPLPLVIEALVQGVVLAGAWVLIARAIPPAYARRGHSVLLVTAALIYIGFAVAAGSLTGLLIELVGVTIFGSIALRGARGRTAALLGVGWLLHPLWDVALHPGAIAVGDIGSYATPTYVIACISFDWMLAWVVLSSRSVVAAPVASSIGAG